MERKELICCASQALSQTEKNHPATKPEYLTVVWATAKLWPYLMANKLDIYRDHYTLQWLKSMRTGSTLLHHWSTALEEFDFTIHHWPSKDQGHVDGLSCLPIEDAPPKGGEAAFRVQTLPSKETTWQAAEELHRSTHVGGDTLWKLFQDYFD